MHVTLTSFLTFNISHSKGNSRSACSLDFSHLCEVSANYLPNHVAMTGTTCDALMTNVVVVGSDSALAGESFSSAYNCSGKSDETKTSVNTVAAMGCCGGNSNGKAILFLALLIILR